MLIVFLGEVLGASVLAASSTVPPSDPNLINVLLIPFLSSLLGGGIAALAFRGAIDSALEKSRTLEVLVNKMVVENSTVKHLQQESDNFRTTYSSALSEASRNSVKSTEDLHRMELKMQELVTGMDYIKSALREMKK